MSRIARKDIVSKYYHIMVQGINKEAIFEEDNFKIRYLYYLRKSLKNRSVILIAYCVMNNHIHILLFSEDVFNISKLMLSVNTQYAKYYNDITKRCGYVYRDRFKIEIIKNQRHLLNCIRYIHNNPVKAKICSKALEYKFSSFRDYYYGKVSKEIIFMVFGENNDYKKTLLIENGEYNFMDIEPDDCEKKRIIKEIMNKYKDYNLLNNNTIKRLIYEIKENVNISNIEIAKLLELKKTRFYDILKSK